MAELSRNFSNARLVDLIEKEDPYFDDVLSGMLERLKLTTTPERKMALLNDVKTTITKPRPFPYASIGKEAAVYDGLSFVHRFNPTRGNYFKWNDAGTTLVVKLRPLVADLRTVDSEHVPLSIKGILQMAMNEICEKYDQLETFALEGLTDLEVHDDEMGPFKAGESANEHAIVDLRPLLLSLSRCRRLNRVEIWECTLPPLETIDSLLNTMREVMQCCPRLNHFSLREMTFCEYDAGGNNPHLLTTRTKHGEIIEAIRHLRTAVKTLEDGTKNLYGTESLRVQFTTQAIYLKDGKQRFSAAV